MSDARIEPGPDGQTPARHGGVRRRAAYFYGLIICGAVLAAEPENISAWIVGVALVATVLVYWTAETFAHWIAERASHGRTLTGAERWGTVTDGLPLVLAAFVPAAVVLVEAVAGVATTTAGQVALLVNVVLLGVVGWLMSPTERPLSARRLGYAVITVLLGLALIVLKNLVHHQPTSTPRITR